MFYLNSTLNFGILPVMVFQWEVYYMEDRLLSGLAAHIDVAISVYTCTHSFFVRPKTSTTICCCCFSTSTIGLTTQHQTYGLAYVTQNSTIQFKFSHVLMSHTRTWGCYLPPIYKRLRLGQSIIPFEKLCDPLYMSI